MGGFTPPRPDSDQGLAPVAPVAGGAFTPPPVTSHQYEMGSPEYVQDRIKTRAPKFGLDPAIGLGLAESESNFRQSATSPTGPRGVFQLTKATAKRYGADREDVDSNIDAGLKYFKDLLDQNHGDITKATATYKGVGAAPPGYVHILGGATMQDVSKAMSLMGKYGAKVPTSSWSHSVGPSLNPTLAGIGTPGSGGHTTEFQPSFGQRVMSNLFEDLGSTGPEMARMFSDPLGTERRNQPAPDWWDPKHPELLRQLPPNPWDGARAVSDAIELGGPLAAGEIASSTAAGNAGRGIYNVAKKTPLVGRVITIPENIYRAYQEGAHPPGQQPPSMSPPPVHWGPEGPGPVAPPPVRYGPQAPTVAAPPIRYGPEAKPVAPPGVHWGPEGQGPVAPPPIRYGPEGPGPVAAPPVHYGPESQPVAAPPVQWGPEGPPPVGAPPVKYGPKPPRPVRAPRLRWGPKDEPVTMGPPPVQWGPEAPQAAPTMPAPPVRWQTVPPVGAEPPVPPPPKPPIPPPVPPGPGGGGDFITPPVPEGAISIPPVQGRPHRYNEMTVAGGSELSDMTVSKDMRIASNLQQEGITPEQWHSWDADKQDAYAARLGYKAFGKGGRLGRPREAGIKDIAERLRELWGNKQ